MDDREEPEEGPNFFAQDGPGLFAESAPASTEPDEPLALYRRYRPDVFSEIIGQEHVTEPLKRSLANNRVNHAYLFSGPRGCGKTSSARILARSLNCELGPTPNPCGVCESCRNLARGGPGSIDVIEIDAASHGGVDDARDLRERAFFAPVHSRYKIYIVDEAHMVTTQGFNALLKLVEEPPPHVKFIFATTEPEKVIGTIRSRTHHYPFRLIPPKTMTSYLTQICTQEKVSVEPGVIALVVRAGAGSVRDSLSILDQLFGGASESQVEYTQAASLLGYTPDSLLDSVVDAIVASDAGSVFAGIDKVIETGQDPRRFGDDLLTRLRDLMIIAAVPDALSSGLLDVAGDQSERFLDQVKQTSVGALTRAAQILGEGLVAMRGTTSPRLQLELMCARILLPGSESGERGLVSRIERLEQALDKGSSGNQTQSRTQQVPNSPVPKPHPPSTPPKPTPPHIPSPISSSKDSPVSVAPDLVRTAAPVTAPVPATAGPTSATVVGATPSTPASSQPSTSLEATPLDLRITDVQRHWEAILTRVMTSRRYLWMILNQFIKGIELHGQTLWLTFSDTGSRDNFNRSNGDEQLAKAILDEMGVSVLVRARLESEPIPTDTRTHLRPTTDTGSDQSTPEPAPHRKTPEPSPCFETPEPSPCFEPEDAEDDAPREDDAVVESETDQAEELMRELFSAELVKEETTKPTRTRPGSNQSQ